MFRSIFRLSHRLSGVASRARFQRYGRSFSTHLQQPVYKSNQKIFYDRLPVALLAFSIPFFNNNDTEEKDPIVDAFKRGVLAAQKDDYQLSQKFFHQGLDIAAQQHREKSIDDRTLLLIQINAYGRMADIAIKFKDFVPAEKLYKATIEKCMQAGEAHDAPSVVELLLKLSSLYAMQSRDNEADVGFSACLKATEARIDKEGGLLNSDSNSLALYGLTCQSYARFKMKIKKNSEAVELYKKSLDIAEEVYGALHPQVLIVLGDLASAYISGRNYSDGIKCYQLAVERAKSQEDSEHPEQSLFSQAVLNYNLGEAYILLKEFRNAQKCCDECLSVATKLGDPKLLQAAKQCTTDVREVKQKCENKKR